MKSGIGFLAFRLCRWASVLLVILLSLLVVSCDLWNKDMLGYLEHWSETVQLGKVEVSDATIQKNDSGVDTIPVAATPTIAAYVINPKSYALLAEIGDSSSSDRSVRISSQSVQTKAQVVAHESTLLKIQLGSADGSLEHTEFRVDFEAIRKDTMQSSGQVMGVTLQYNTPPRAPLALMWDSSNSAFVQLQSQAWQPTTGTGTDKDGYIYWGWPEDSYVGSNSFDETAADCVAQFSINGTLHDASNLLVKDSNGSVESFISGSAPYDVYGLQVGSGISVSLFAQDSEGVAGTSLRSGVAPYTITLLGNGGQYNGADTHQLYLQGGSTITKDDLAIFQKQGYKISGWRDSNGAISFPYTVKNDVTLTAQWTVNEYTVTLDDDGGSGGSGSVKVIYGQTPPKVNAPRKAGHDFGGYWTQRNGGGTQYYDKDGNGVNTWQVAQNTSLYAKWEVIYDISYKNTDGAFMAGAYPVGYTVDGLPVKLTPATNKTGYTFGGWHNGTRVITEIAQGTTGDITLTAQWIPNVYTVQFNANGGNGSMDGQQFTYGQAKNLTAIGFTRTGYTFTGWNTQANGGGTSYTNGQSVSNLTAVANSTVTLYAQWEVTAGGANLQGGTITATISGSSYAFTGGAETLDSFWISDHEVTQKEWLDVMGSEPVSGYNGQWGKGDNYPVHGVSWYETLVYCNKRSINEGLEPVYTIKGSTNPDDWGQIPTAIDPDWSAAQMDSNASGYRLPTNVEWVYAAAGGDPSKPDWNYTYVGGNDINEVAWYRDNSGTSSHEVKGKKPNSLGLYDMSGNVYEWCWEHISDNTHRRTRGGSFYASELCKLGFDNTHTPIIPDAVDGNNTMTGLRVVRSQ